MCEPTSQSEAFLSHSANDKAVVRPSSLSASTGEGAAARGRRLGLPQDELKAPSDLEFVHSDFGLAKAGPFRFRDPLNPERRFIPRRLDDAPITGSLAGSVYTNRRAANREPGHAAIKEAIPEP